MDEEPKKLTLGDILPKPTLDDVIERPECECEQCKEEMKQAEVDEEKQAEAEEVKQPKDDSDEPSDSSKEKSEIEALSEIAEGVAALKLSIKNGCYRRLASKEFFSLTLFLLLVVLLVYFIFIYFIY